MGHSKWIYKGKVSCRLTAVREFHHAKILIWPFILKEQKQWVVHYFVLIWIQRTRLVLDSLIEKFPCIATV